MIRALAFDIQGTASASTSRCCACAPRLDVRKVLELDWSGRPRVSATERDAINAV